MRLAAIVFVFLSTSAFAQERTAAKLKVDAVDVWVTRARDAEGGIIIKLIARGVGPKPQALTIYTGGGADDGAGDEEVTRITAKAFELPGGKHGVRVDWTFKIPDGKKHEEETTTALVGFEGKTHKLYELRTRMLRDRNKNCREGEEVALSVDETGALIAGTSYKTDPTFGDDDLPIDKTCKAPRGVAKKSYAWKGDRWIDPDDEPTDGGAPPAPATKKPAADDD